MDRINSANTTDLGGGKRGFKDENVVGGTAGTDVAAAHMNAVQEEILYVIEQSGQVPDANDWTQLSQALLIQSPIANNPVFPEIETASNALAITDNANGTITLNAAQTWLWRGLQRISSDYFILADRTLAHVASKTYHLRWHAPGTGTAIPVVTYPKGRVELVDMTAAAPAESDASYDSTYDRMLIAKIVTDAANVPTITALANKAVMSGKLTAAARNYSGASEADHNFYFTVNWARSPDIALAALRPPGNAYDSDYEIYPVSVTRYQVHMYSWSWQHNSFPAQSPGFDLKLGA